MKPLLLCLSTVILYTFFIMYQQDYGQAYLKSVELKYIAEELSVSGTLFYDKTEYGEGRKVFNQAEALKAIRDQLKIMLILDDSFLPLPSSYWIDSIEYVVYFYDDSNTEYPFLFTDDETSFMYLVANPTVIIKIDAGRAGFRIPFFRDSSHIIRIAAHEVKERKMQ